ncbi:MAG: hypothetical protein C3F11_03640 [Methylocystaceae bacterium]|nr:MAG: hypothetical protein C3F11_03640 [Methylocystaceae bacterium]
MAVTPKLTTSAACRVARIDRDRLNEHIAAGRFGCAPDTIPGRARLFDPDDMIALWLFRELIGDGLDVTRAGAAACEVARVARQYPDSNTITLIEDYFVPPTFHALPTSQVAKPEEWDTIGHGGVDVRKATTFNISKTRKLIAHYTEEERSIIGEAD